MDETDASRCATFLQERWHSSGGLRVESELINGYNSYPVTLGEHSAADQAANTVLITSDHLELVCCSMFSKLTIHLPPMADTLTDTPHPDIHTPSIMT